MKKVSSQHIPCTYCEADALPGTNPPVCSKHKGMKKKATEGKTLKELEAELGNQEAYKEAQDNSGAVGE